ncbi:hypothetical protein HID58_047766 [Brassica napus]|uniref:Uncharacterized protein n=1 Tax=Brassica napus TaxID=3708 RepID=A0ABQ8B0G0_BRANA|nr:hypothetical protein HID58_047766 [Brassica napus]
MDNFTKLEADVVIHERLLQPAFIQKLLFYSDTGHATAAPLLRGYAKVEPLTIAELNEFSDKNEEELRKLQRTVSAFTCVHCNNTNAVGVLRYGVEMVIADDTAVESILPAKAAPNTGAGPSGVNTTKSPARMF